MSTKGSIKSNDFARGASNKGRVSTEDKQAKRQALLAQAKQKMVNSQTDNSVVK